MALKVFQVPVVDEHGGEFPQAVVVFNAVKIPMEKSIDIVGDNHEVSIVSDTVTFSVNYWYSEGLRAQGRKSRLLFDTELDSSFTLDITDYQSVFDQSGGTEIDKFFKVCERHLRTVINTKNRMPPEPKEA